MAAKVLSVIARCTFAWYNQEKFWEYGGRPIIFLDIHSKKSYPSCALSNFAVHPFVLDGVAGSVHGGVAAGTEGGA